MKKTIFAILVVLLFSSMAVFAQSFSILNTDASKINPLVCSLAGVPQSDYGDYDFTWTKQGLNLGTSKIFVQPAASLVKGEVWQCEVSMQIISELDGSAYTVFFGTATTTIVNVPPTFTSTPITTGNANVIYNYDVNANDLDGDSLTYSLDAASIGNGMTINANTGAISWMPTISRNYPITVSVNDGTATATQAYTIVVGAAPSPIIVSVNANRTSGLAPLSVAFTSTATGGSGAYTYSWDFNNDGNFDAVGNSVNSVFSANSTVRVVVTDSNIAGLTGQTTVRITITNGTVVPPTNHTSDTHADEDDLFVDSITLDSYDLHRGDSVVAHVTIENQGEVDMDDMIISMSIVDLGLKEETAKFDLDNDEKKTKDIMLDLPSDVANGNYFVKFTIKNDDVSVERIKEITIDSGNAQTYTSYTGSRANTASDIVLVTSAPSITSYAPGNKSPKTNWTGIVTAIVFLFVLIGLAIYLIQKLRAQKKNDQLNIIALDGDNV